ncbi:MAG: hypothetical protein JKX99_02420 [Robiginitomaculum sp.]|nr:hypothetical protein [Robiginitomaculum sp.]
MDQENLKIKSFVGTSKNAVVTQVWIALCVYLLLAFLRFQLKSIKTLRQILRLLHLNLFKKRDLMALLRGGPLHINKFTINQPVCCKVNGAAVSVNIGKIRHYINE